METKRNRMRGMVETISSAYQRIHKNQFIFSNTNPIMIV
jgi:hypothetical protein